MISIFNQLLRFEKSKPNYLLGDGTRAFETFGSTHFEFTVLGLWIEYMSIHRSQEIANKTFLTFNTLTCEPSSLFPL